MKDIGFVKFKLSKDKSVMNSEWVYKINDNTYSGTGIVVGNINDSHEGKFKVTYYNENNEITHSYGLEIIKSDNHYNLQWIQKDKVLYEGIGMCFDNILYAGWNLI